MFLSMNKYSVILLAVAIGLMTSCRRVDNQSRTIKLPGLKNTECGTIISNAIARYAHMPNMVKAIQTDSMVFNYEERTLVITYDSMKTEIKNIEHVIAQTGFAANEIPADPEGVKKLPASCR